MNKCVGDMEPYIRFRKKNCKLCLQCKASNSTKHQVVIHEIVKIQPSDPIHFLPTSTVLKSTQLVQARSGFWHHDVMAKRIIIGVWKVKNKGSNNEEGNHVQDKRKSRSWHCKRSGDCHATDTHRAISVWKLSNGTSGGATNSLAHEDLELTWGVSSLEYTSQVL